MRYYWLAMGLSSVLALIILLACVLEILDAFGFRLEISPLVIPFAGVAALIVYRKQRARTGKYH